MSISILSTVDRLYLLFLFFEGCVRSDQYIVKKRYLFQSGENRVRVTIISNTLVRGLSHFPLRVVFPGSWMEFCVSCL